MGVAGDEVVHPCPTFLKVTFQTQGFLVLEGRGILRPKQRVLTARGEGETTSGGFAPTLRKAIAFARIPAGTDLTCEVEIRGKLLPARIVKAPFVRNGAACAGIL